MAKVSEIIAYLEKKCGDTQQLDPEISIRELVHHLDWPDYLPRSSRDDPDCYCE